MNDYKSGKNNSKNGGFDRNARNGKSSNGGHDSRDSRGYKGNRDSRDSRTDRPYGSKPYSNNRSGSDSRPSYPRSPRQAGRGDNNARSDYRPIRRDLDSDFTKKLPFDESAKKPEKASIADAASAEPEHRMSDDVICGRNTVYEALTSGRDIDSILMARGGHDSRAGHILAAAAERGIPVKNVAPQKLDYMCAMENHQGVAAVLAAAKYYSVEDILDNAKRKDEQPFIIICDEIEDPHNLGAIIRTAEATGVHGVIVPKRRNAPLTAAVAKSACGALEYVPVARVSNLSSTIDDLKSKGIWVYGAHMEGSDYRKQDYSGGCALVIGNEGNGIGRLIKEKCDVLVSLPMKGKINSLNASVAAGILMYEVATKR